MRFSANLGFLFTDRPLPDAIHAAYAAGFDAVECHFPYDSDPGAVRAALDATGLPMLGLNTWPGDRDAGEFGLAALPGREPQARAAIAQAVDYAQAIGAGAVHVMAGRTDGGAGAEAAFRANLAHACDLAAPHGLTILIEPINRRDVPGYHLSHTAQAAGIIAALDRPNLALMFDCYHLQIMEGDLSRRFEALLPIIGHVQIAGVPERGAPDAGEVDLCWLLARIKRLGWTRPVGAEYKPAGGDTEASLAWLPRFQAI
jgi:hydroxypyruvate isomerase